MQAFLKYTGLFFLMVIAASLALLAVGVYQTFGKISAFMAGADTYTCGQLTTDMTSDGTSKMFPILMGTLVYGGSLDKAAFEAEMEQGGVIPGLKKVMDMCARTPETKLFDLFAKDIAAGVSTGGDAVAATLVAPLMTSSTQPVTQK